MSSSKNPWDDADEDGGENTARASVDGDEFGTGADDQGHPDDRDGIVDAQVTEVAPKKSKILPILIGVGAVALAVAGYIGFTFYQKFFPSAGSTQASVGILSEELPPNEPPAPATVPMAAGADVPPAQGAAGVVPMAEGGPSLTPEQASINAMKDAPVVAEVPVVAPPAAVQTVAIAPTLPAAVIPPAAAPVKAPVVIAPKPLVCSEVCPQVETKSAVAKKKPVARPTRQVASAKSPAKASSAKPAAATASPAATASAASESSGDMGKLTNYTVLAFEPKTGPHQQAWIRGRDNRIYVVRAGDTLEGARVESVNFASGAVMTTRGEIRK